MGSLAVESASVHWSPLGILCSLAAAAQGVTQQQLHHVVVPRLESHLHQEVARRHVYRDATLRQRAQRDRS